MASTPNPTSSGLPAGVGADVGVMMKFFRALGARTAPPSTSQEEDRLARHRGLLLARGGGVLPTARRGHQAAPLTPPTPEQPGGSPSHAWPS